MIHNWYRIFSLTEFLATGLVSRTYTVSLEGIGQVDILVTRGNLVNVLFQDTFLGINFNDENPYYRSPYAVYVDPDNGVWVGIEVQA